MNWLEIFWNIVLGASNTVMMIMVILIPLMLGIELIKDAKLLDRAANSAQPVMKLFTLPREAAFPLLAGILFGICYGSGIISSFTKNGGFTKRDITLICILLSICHGLIEDTLIYVAIGANWWVLVLIRICFTFLTMLIIIRIRNNKTIRKIVTVFSEKEIF